ncbi:HD domain-containing protein [Phyllobacterium lublinensis]|uniref:HD domain-containing protein n=1 Tax=Phyllobacterium lublinensis TaxID=2875708 RepID=UPI001CCB1F2E|nr:HD domain-containing protein [Phyllobacterium sp. 2063]MBZ9653181.1 HD domain-containing protein [Phyllobacterium sp. 2063]
MGIDDIAGFGNRLSGHLQFLMVADGLRRINRANRIADGSRFENSAEHSWHLTLCALVFQELAPQAVSIDRVIKMLILHDIVEIDAGDTPIFSADAASQEAGEQEAASRLFGLLPDGLGMEFRALWDEFEAAQTPDARFAKALDRFQPILLDYAVSGGSWLDFAVKEDALRKLVRAIRDVPELWDVADALISSAKGKGWLA